MPRRFPAVLAVLLAAAAAAPAARAQDLASICRGVIHPPVGAWSEFKVVGGRADGATMKMAVVGSETRADTALLWIEYVAHGFPAGSGAGPGDTLSFIHKMLVPGYGPGMEQPRALIVKVGSAPAMQMPVGQPGGPGGPGSTPLEDCASGTVVGWESVTVPAGTFRALHVRDAKDSGDAWIAPALPFALVKAAMGGAEGDSGDMVLTAHGTGAKSEITETPRPYDPQAFWQMMLRADSGH
jgi:hypothetical protein